MADNEVANKVIPKMMMEMTKIFAWGLLGIKSPYPTVLMVTTEK